MPSRPFRLDAPLDFTSLEDVPRVTRRLERLGFDAAWTQEGVHDPFLPLAVAATSSTRLTLGTAVALAFPRSPMLIAYLAWDLARATRGRFVLGLGPQVRAHIERRFSAAWDPPGPRLREAVQAIHAVWERWQHGTPLDFRGTYYSFTLMPAPFVPAPLDWYDIPIYLAGVNAYSCRLAGEVADGLHVHPLHTPAYLRHVIVSSVDDGLARTQRKRSDFTIAVSAFIGTGRTATDVARARQAVRAQIAFYASTRTYRAVMDLHGWGETADRLRRLSLAEQWPAMSQEVSDAILEEMAIIGHEDDVVPRLVSRYGGVADRVTPYPLGTTRDQERLLALLSRELPK
jgi:probable F420-dependent oxidoreductase